MMDYKLFFYACKYNVSNLPYFHFRYIYGGRLSLEEYDALDIIKILVAADELNLQELIPCIESF